MFDIAESLLSWSDHHRPVLLGRMLDGHGLAGRSSAPVAAMTEGAPAAGSAMVARAFASGPGVVEVTLSDDQAADVGLTCGGHATVLVQPAGDLPESFWADVRAGSPVGLVDALDGSAPTSTFGAADVPERFARFFGRGVSQVVVVEGEVLTTYWPRTRVLVVGAGGVAAALVAQAELLGWSAQVVDDARAATSVLAGFGRADAVVVLSHDRDVDGPVLTAAVGGPVGYVGAMGSRRTQAARRDWFAAHDVVGTERIHGPAGLDIGGFGPAEIALSITAEIVAVRSGSA